MGHISMDPKESGNEILGHVRYLRDIVNIFQIDELIIGGAGISAEQEIEWMSQLEDSRIEIRIAPADGAHIIGSQSIRGNLDGQSDDLIQLSTGTARRNKRLLDIFLSVIFLFLSPILVFICGPGIWRNSFKVIFGKMNWVGFISHKQDRQSVLDVEDIINQGTEMTEQIRHQLNLQYARHYSPLTDLRIVLKNLRKLGR